MRRVNTKTNNVEGHVTLNKNTLKILVAIAMANRRGLSPSLKELCVLSGILNVNGTDYHIRRLKKLGLVESAGRHKARALRATCQIETFCQIRPPLRFVQPEQNPES